MAQLFNATCPIPLSELRKPNHEEPIVGKVTFQQILIYISLGSAAYTTIVCIYLASTHLLHYVRAREQRQIIRLSFYPLFFAVFSAACVYTYPDSIYLQPTRDLIEPVSLAALFLLFLEYAEPDPDRREEYFRNLELRVQKSRFSREVKTIPGGSYRWFQGKWVALFCYFIADVVMKIVELITQLAGRYCQSSFSLAYAHIWCSVISYIALPVGIIAVIQFYVRIRHEPHVRIHRTTQKIWAFKGVLLLNFFQEIIFTILVAARIFKGTKQITLRDFQIGIPSCLLVVEQVIASTLFLWAFPVKPYRQMPEKKMNPAYALLNACNIMDVIYGSIYAVQLLAKGVGPYGNGSWNRRKGGYGKLKDPITDVAMRRSATIRSKNMDIDSTVSSYEPMRATRETPMANIEHGDRSPPEYKYEDRNNLDRAYEASYHDSADLGVDRERLLDNSHQS